MNELPEDLSFKDSILKRAIVASRLLLVKKGEPDLLNHIWKAARFLKLVWIYLKKTSNFGDRLSD